MMVRRTPAPRARRWLARFAARGLRLLPALAIPVAVAALPAPAAAQGAGQRTLSADEKALERYRLTMPTLRKVAKATENLFHAAMQNPDVAKSAKLDGNATLDGAAAAYDRVPQVRSAFASAGVTSREYVLANMALLQAMMTMSFMDAEGPTKLKEVPPGVSKENVAFVRQNKDEIGKIFARLQELDKQWKAKHGDGANGGAGDAGGGDDTGDAAADDSTGGESSGG